MSNGADDRPVAVVQAVRYKKQDGVLVLTKDSLGWSPEGNSELALNVSYTKIKTHRLSKETGKKYQLQLVYHDGSTANLHFAGDAPKEERQKISQLLLQLVPNVTQKASSDLEAKKALLQSDPNLYQLYRDLVIPGIISTEEFWANRISQSNTESEQRSGITSAFLGDVPAVADGCNALKLNITPDDIQAIFLTYPSVKAKHAQLVPDQMTESDFWVQFFQSQKFHRDRKNQPKASTLFDDCLRKDLAAVTSGSSARFEGILPSKEVPVEGYSEEQVYAPEANSSILERCNVHSALVLHNIHSGGKVKETDLPATEPQDISLRLQYGRPQTSADSSPLYLRQLSLDLSHSNTQTHLQPLSSSSATMAMSHLLPGGSLLGSLESEGHNVSHSTVQLIVRHQTAIAELLCHFWACFPVHSPSLEQKIQRMAHCLQQYRDEKLSTLRSELSPSDLPLAENLSDWIDVALSRYQDWKNRLNKSN